MFCVGPPGVHGCVWMSLLISILVLYAQGTFADSQLPVVVSISKKQDFGCDRVLSLTELASKPGLQCTDFVNTFNFGELGGGLVPGANDHRPGIEVNFHNTVFRNHTVPTAEQIPYGFTQGKCHTTKMNEDGTAAKYECSRTFVETAGSFTTKGVFDMYTGKANYAILGGTGTFMGAWGEVIGQMAVEEEPVLGETAELFKYDVCIYLPSKKKTKAA